MKLATLWARIGGGFIDLLIVLVISTIILFGWGFSIGLSGKEVNLSADLQDELWKGRGLLVGFLVDLIYTVTLQASSQQATLGQKASDLIIVKSDGTKASIGTLTARYFLSLISSIFIKLGYLVALFTKRKQTLHDLIADTVVIEKNLRILSDENIEINQNNDSASNQKNIKIIIGLFLIALTLVSFM
jgi:uncharacterized RDD family membrane protein YckC